MSGKTIKCDMCGANLRFGPGEASVVCPYCNTQQWSTAHGAAAQAAAPEPERQQSAPPVTEPETGTPREQRAESGGGALPWLVRLGRALQRLPASVYRVAGIGSAILFLAWANWFTMLLTIALFWHPWTLDKRYDRRRKLYNEALERFRKAKTAAEFEEVKTKFLQLPGFADAEQKARECEEMIRRLGQREKKRRENTEDIKDLAQEAAASLLNRAADALRNKRGK